MHGRTLLMGSALIGVAAAGVSTSHAQLGGAVQRQYEVGAFNAISVAGPYDVQVRTTGQPSVRASGSKELLDRLVVEVRDGRLMIHPRRERGFNWNSRGKAVVQVTGPMLRAAAIGGSGGINIDRIAGQQFAGSIGGSGDLQIGALAVQSLALTIGGSGDIAVRSGRAARAKYSIGGSGGIDARGLRATDAEISIAGSGNIRGQVIDDAAVSIMGSGGVQLTGGAKCAVVKVGSGSVRCS